MEITEGTRRRLLAYLYKEYEKDTTCVEVNELLDILEGKNKEEEGEE